MKEHPILFSGEMVRAILDGRKTQTRRVVKPQPPEDASLVAVGHYHPTVIRRGEEEPGAETFGATWCDGEFALPCPFGQPGDRLWVRETWENGNLPGEEPMLHYRAADPDLCVRWRSPIHMPRWASRITLEVTGVRVERVQEINEDDAISEGVDAVSMRDVPRQATRNRREDFCQLWNLLNAKRGYGWDANPWVWVIEFKRVDAATAVAA